MELCSDPLSQCDFSLVSSCDAGARPHMALPRQIAELRAQLLELEVFHRSFFAVPAAARRRNSIVTPSFRVLSVFCLQVLFDQQKPT